MRKTLKNVQKKHRSMPLCRREFSDQAGVTYEITFQVQLPPPPPNRVSVQVGLKLLV